MRISLETVYFLFQWGVINMRRPKCLWTQFDRPTNNQNRVSHRMKCVQSLNNRLWLACHISCFWKLICGEKQNVSTRDQDGDARLPQAYPDWPRTPQDCGATGAELDLNLESWFVTCWPDPPSLPSPSSLPPSSILRWVLALVLSWVNSHLRDRTVVLQADFLPLGLQTPTHTHT